jgi:hypothetical protein
VSAWVRAPGTPPWLVLYGLVLLCVLSFVLFEVLDVDGSEFQATSSRVAIKAAEAPPEALRRGVAGLGVATVAAPLVTGLAAPSASAVDGPRPPRRGRPVRPVVSARAALPRALLSDVPPSA